MSKRKLLAQPESLAWKGIILGKGRDVEQCSASMWLLQEEVKTHRFLGSGFIRDALLLL